MNHKKLTREQDNPPHTGVIFFDAINGEDCPMTFEDLCEQVRDNPFCTDGNENQEFFFSSCGTISYSIQEIADVVGVKLESEEDYL